MKRWLTPIAVLMAVALLALAAPALAQDADDPAKSGRRRSFPPAWLDLSIDELKTKVEDRAAAGSERVSDSRWLSDELKVEILDKIDSMLVAVEAADANAEVVGTVVSRTQLQRLELRAERTGDTVDYDAHIRGDADRANRRLELLTKVTGWAEAAGEDVAAITAYLDETAARLGDSLDGAVEERHDSVHIALAWLARAATGLDAL